MINAAKKPRATRDRGFGEGAPPEGKRDVLLAYHRGAARFFLNFDDTSLGRSIWAMEAPLHGRRLRCFWAATPGCLRGADGGPGGQRRPLRTEGPGSRGEQAGATSHRRLGAASHKRLILGPHQKYQSKSPALSILRKYRARILDGWSYLV